MIPGSFIAKSEVARWPFFGWLAKLQRSVFVDRQVRSTATQRDAIGERLAAGDALILFPEGTSGDGNRVLPFKSALFARRATGRGRSPGNRSAGLPCLHTPRRNTDRAALPAVLRMVRRGRPSAPPMEHGGSRDRRGRSRISSADLSLAIADHESRWRNIAHARIAGGVAAALFDQTAADAGTAGPWRALFRGELPGAMPQAAPE